MCKDQLCVKHAKFLSPFFTNARKNIKPELLLDIVLLSKLFGGEVGGFGGGEASPPHPPVDETLIVAKLTKIIFMRAHLASQYHCEPYIHFTSVAEKGMLCMYLHNTCKCVDLPQSKLTLEHT